MTPNPARDIAVFITAGQFVGLKKYSATSEETKVVAQVAIDFAHLLRKPDSRVHRYTFAEVADLIEQSCRGSWDAHCEQVISELRALHERQLEVIAAQAAQTQH